MRPGRGSARPAYLVAGTVYSRFQTAARDKYLPLLSENGIITNPHQAVTRKGKFHYVCDMRLEFGTKYCHTSPRWMRTNCTGPSWRPPTASIRPGRRSRMYNHRGRAQANKENRGKDPASGLYPYERKLNKDRKRSGELNGLIKKLYESYATEKILEKRFELLSGKYEEYSAFIERVQRGLASFHLPNYEEVPPALSQEQLHTLTALTDSCRKTLEDYLSFVFEA